MITGGAYGLDDGTKVKVGPAADDDKKAGKGGVMPNEEPGDSARRATAQKPFWLARSTRTIFFFAAMLTLAGVYLAFQVPISVFPETNFPASGHRSR